MPDRIISLIQSDIVMTIFSILLMFSFANIFVVIGGLFSTMFWVYRIKKEQVDKDNGGSWLKWIKSFINK